MMIIGGYMGSNIVMLTDLSTLKVDAVSFVR